MTACRFGTGTNNSWVARCVPCLLAFQEKAPLAQRVMLKIDITDNVTGQLYATWRLFELSEVANTPHQAATLIPDMSSLGRCFRAMHTSVVDEVLLKYHGPFPTVP